MPNLLSRLIDPWYPATALGLKKGVASVGQLERIRGSACKLRRAATFNIDESLVRPSFDESNIPNGAQLAAVLKDLATSAGLLRQKRWALSLPEATTRTLVLTIASQSAGELQEGLRWKIERGFGAALEELSFSKDRLQKDTAGRGRYLLIRSKASRPVNFRKCCAGRSSVASAPPSKNFLFPKIVSRKIRLDAIAIS